MFLLFKEVKTYRVLAGNFLKVSPNKHIGGVSMLLRSTYHQRGSHLLEFALAVSVLFFLVAGAFDINTALQGYTALQEGVKQSLRCAYPTDGKCVKADPGTKDRLFQVTKYSKPKISYILNQYDFSGKASWFQKTTLHHHAEATVADKITYSHTITTPGITTEGKAATWKRTDFLPYVSGAGLDPDTNGYPVKKGENYFTPGTGDINLGKPDGHGGILLSAASKSFTINNPFKEDMNAPCEVVQNDYQNAGSCDADKKNANIMFLVKGTVSGSGHGSIAVRLLSNAKVIRTLGGRRINEGDTAHDDFTSRGLEANCTDAKHCVYTADKDFTLQYKKEAMLHNNITAPYGTDLQIEFELIPEGQASLAWSATEIKVFTSRYEYEAAVAATTGKDQTETKAITADCPFNYGSGNLAADCQSLCQVNDPKLVPGSASCSTKIIYPISDSDFTATCENPSFDDGDINPEFFKYPVRYMQETKTVEDIYTHDQDPAELLKTTPPYSCKIMPLVEKIIDDPQVDGANVKLNSQSLFAGIWPDQGCGWEEALKHAAINDLPEGEKINENAYFKADRAIRGHTETNDKPFNQCVQYYPLLKEAGPAENLGQFAYADIKNACPANQTLCDCISGKAFCKQDFLGFTAGTEANADANLETAVNSYGIPEIQSNFPRANFNSACKEGYCAELKALPSNDPNIVTFAAKMRVPLTVTKILGLDGIDLSYTDSHRLEKVYSK
jgi:hypothetical protein